MVRNSVISQPAAELHGIPGVNVGYSYGTVIQHNEVYNTTWCAISMGYGAANLPHSSSGLLSEPQPWTVSAVTDC